MNDKVGAQLKGLLVIGRREGVVHYQHGARPVRRLARHRDVGHLAERIARGLQEDHLRVRLDGLRHLRAIGRVEPRDVNGEALQHQRDLIVRSIDVMEDDEAVAGAQIREERHGAGGHAGRADDAVFGALEFRNRSLDRPDGRVVVAVVGITVGDLSQDFDRRVFVVDGVDDRRDHRAIAVRRQRILRPGQVPFLVHSHPPLTAVRESQHTPTRPDLPGHHARCGNRCCGACMGG